MKSKTITLLSLLMILLTGCTENWQLKQVQSDIFLIDLPVGTSEVEKVQTDYIITLNIKLLCRMTKASM